MEEYKQSPWSVECLEEFLYFCCPECDHREHSKDYFIQHAFAQHPDAAKVLSLLAYGINIKTETSDFIEYDIPEINNTKNYEVDLKCDIDNQKLTSLKNEQPIDYKNDQNLLQCPRPNCFHQLKSQGGLIYHLNSHKDCPYCEKSFAGSGANRSLKNHIKKHKKPSTLCDNCGKDFKFASNLERHKTSCLKNNHQKLGKECLEKVTRTSTNEYNYNIKIEDNGIKAEITDINEDENHGIAQMYQNLSIVHGSNQENISNNFDVETLDPGITNYSVEIKQTIAQNYEVKKEIQHHNLEIPVGHKERIEETKALNAGNSEEMKLDVPQNDKQTTKIHHQNLEIPVEHKEYIGITNYPVELSTNEKKIELNLEKNYGMGFYKCNICEKYFGELQKLEKHKEKNHPEMNSPQNFTENESSVKMNDRTKCVHCTRTFQSLTARNHHMEKNHNLKCKFCGKIITSRNGLKLHIRGVHENISSYVCDSCGKKYKSKMALDYHVKYFHEGQPIEKNHICEICGKAFETACKVKNHVKFFHEGQEKPHKCELCEYSCISNARMQNHISRVHKGLKNFDCEQCGKLFSAKNDLIKHVRIIHEKQRNFKCDQCDRTFQCKQYLKHHIESVHEGKRKYSCEDCGKTFAHLEGMKCHIKTVHEGIRYQCDYCEKSFTQKPHLKSHMKCHGTLYL